MSLVHVSLIGNTSAVRRLGSRHYSLNFPDKVLAVTSDCFVSLSLITFGLNCTITIMVKVNILLTNKFCFLRDHRKQQSDNHQRRYGEFEIILLCMLFFPLVLPRKPRSKQYCSTSTFPSNQSPVHWNSSLGLVQTYFHEGGVLWMRWRLVYRYHFYTFVLHEM